MRLIDADALGELVSHGLVHYEDIMAQPTVDAVPVRRGRWIYSNDFHWYTASCNKCGYQRRTDIKADGWNQWKFCPMCGSRMDEE